MMYENFRHTHGSGSGAGKNKLHVLRSSSLLCLFIRLNYDSAQFNFITFREFSTVCDQISQ